MKLAVVRLTDSTEDEWGIHPGGEVFAPRGFLCIQTNDESKFEVWYPANRVHKVTIYERPE